MPQQEDIFTKRKKAGKSVSVVLPAVPAVPKEVLPHAIAVIPLNNILLIFGGPPIREGRLLFWELVAIKRKDIDAVIF